MNSKLIKPFVLGAIAAYGGAALVLLSSAKLGVLPVQADFSGQVLSARPSNLAVIRGRGLVWSDLGEPERALSVLNHKGLTSKAEASG